MMYKSEENINILNKKYSIHNELSNNKKNNINLNNINNKKNNNIHHVLLNNKKIKSQNNNFQNDKNMHILNKKNNNFSKKNNFRKYNKNDLLKKKNNLSIKHVVKNIIIYENISISELANKISIKASVIVQKMMTLGYQVTSDHILDQETAQLVIEEMGHKAVLRYENDLEKSIMNDYKNDHKKFKKIIRPPIVTIMGHVDHGKTSLLDYIRSTHVVDHESGGITQHIGAYYVKTKYGIITFLDTPGHAAFTAMRARGAQITDIVILVVASDDGVKPQTIEAIQHAKAANVPLLVVINKIDKPESNIEKVKKELSQHQVLSEEWGGETIFVNVSSITGEGIDDLLHAILLQAEILELSAIESGMVYGVVIEAFLDKNRGPIATVLIRNGTLKIGDYILCGLTSGKIRFIRDSFGLELKSVTPSIPVEILGLSHVPSSGDVFYSIKNEQKAREILLYRKNKFRMEKLDYKPNLDVNNMFENLKNKKKNSLNIILKADVQGSLEAISQAINNFSAKTVFINIISSYVGNITETDVSLAMASKAMIIGFNVRPNVLAKRLIKIENIDVRYYSIIYNLLDDIKTIMLGMLSPVYQPCIIGSAEVRNIFKPKKSISIAGCMVINGIIKRKNSINIIRDNRVIYKGELESLRRFKEDSKEVGVGKECGIKVINYNDIRVGDVIESFEMMLIKNKKLL